MWPGAAPKHGAASEVRAAVAAATRTDTPAHPSTPEGSTAVAAASDGREVTSSQTAPVAADGPDAGAGNGTDHAAVDSAAIEPAPVGRVFPREDGQLFWFDPSAAPDAGPHTTSPENVSGELVP
jgi:hypothetical protein